MIGPIGSHNVQEPWQKEAFQLTRGLLAGVCSAGTTGETGRRLHHAAVAAAARLADGAVDTTREARSEHLIAARAALDELASLLTEAALAGQLSSDLAESLLARRAEASQALARLHVEPPAQA